MNRNVATLLLAAGLCASARTSLARQNPAALTHGPGTLTVYAVGDSGGLYRKDWYQNHWLAWRYLFGGQYNNLAVAPHEGIDFPEVHMDGIAWRNGDWVSTNVPNPDPIPPLPPCPNCLTTSTTYTFPDKASAGPAFFRGQYTESWKAFLVDQSGVLKQYQFISSWSAATNVSGAPQGLTEISVGKVSATQHMICGKTSGTTFKCSSPFTSSPSGAWTTLPGAYSSRPAVARWVSGIPRVFGRGAFDAQVWHTATLFGWEAPIPQGGDIAGSPTAVNSDDQVTHVFGKASWNNSIWYTYQVGTSWAGDWLPVD